MERTIISFCFEQNRHSKSVFCSFKLVRSGTPVVVFIYHSHLITCNQVFADLTIFIQLGNSTTSKPRRTTRALENP